MKCDAGARFRKHIKVTSLWVDSREEEGPELCPLSLYGSAYYQLRTLHSLLILEHIPGNPTVPGSQTPVPASRVCIGLFPGSSPQGPRYMSSSRAKDSCLQPMEMEPERAGDGSHRRVPHTPPGAG